MKFRIVVLLALVVSVASAQSNRKIGIGGGFGSNGASGQLGFKVSDYLFLNAAYSNLQIEVGPLDLSTPELRQSATLNYGLEQTEFMVHVHPFKNWFKISVGASYALDMASRVSLTLLDTVYAGEDGNDPDDLGDFVLYPEDLGFVNIDFIRNNISPYIGLGFGRAVPKKRVGMTLDMGMYYTGSYRIEAEDSGMLVYDEYQSQRLEDSIKSYQWLPKVQLTISISL